MAKRWLRWCAPAAAAMTVPWLTVLPSGVASASPARPATPKAATVSLVKVQSAPEVGSAIKVMGPMESSSTLTGSVVLKPRDEAAVQAFINEATKPGSAEYHHYLARGAYAAQFGPAQSTVSAVESDLRSSGLRVTGVDSDGLLVNFTGRTSQVEAAFHTGLANYRLTNGTIGQGTTSAVELPSTIASSVTAVLGLDNLVHPEPLDLGPISGKGGPPHPAAKTAQFTHPTGMADPCAAASQAASEFGGLTDDQIANAYGATPLYANSDFAGDQSIAVFELEPFLSSDLQSFDQCYFPTTYPQMLANVNVVPVDGGQPAGPGSGEAILDLDDVSAMAPGAKIDVYEAPNNTFGSIDNYAAIVNNDADQVVTSSWGLCEQALQEGEPGTQQAENLLFEQAAAQGQSIFSAAGDTGSDDCNSLRTPSPVSPILSVDDPGSNPYVISVGGTTIDDANQPPSEHVWNDGANWGAGGGGISESWTSPIWQQLMIDGNATNASTVAAAVKFEDTQDPGQTNPSYAFCATTGAQTPCREVPDVTAQADEFTGAVTTDYDGTWSTIGGTSSSTPIWAGLLALINDSNTGPACADADAGSNGGTAGPGVGFASPLLYELASDSTAYSASFNNVTTGDNDPYGDSNLFPAGTGFNMASGLGSPQLTGAAGTPGLAYYLCDLANLTSPVAVTSVTPNVGPAAGAPVTLTLSSSEDVEAVQIGHYVVPLSKTRRLGTAQSNQISVTVPPAIDLVPPGDDTGGIGTYPITVLTSAGISQPTAASEFTYVSTNHSSQPVPTVTSVHAYGGPDGGANTVDIFGTGFTGATAVTFGAQPATFTVTNDNEIVATPPAYSPSLNCAYDGSTYGTGEDASNDICQTQVVVSNSNGPSPISTILPFFEGEYAYTPLAILPPPTGEEVAPAATEYDYAPAPTITSISTSAGPSAYANEDPTTANPGTVVTITGTGFNLATLDWINFGPSAQSASQVSEIPDLLYISGTKIVVVAPGLPATTTDSTTLPVSVMSLAGLSNVVNANYSGIPVVSTVSADGAPGAADTGGTPVSITGQGFLDASGPITFIDVTPPPPGIPPFSYGTQYNYTVNSDGSISTATVPQNPGAVDTQVCTTSGCSTATSTETPPSDADVLLLYPPGAPAATSIAPSSGPGTGGTPVTITGTNLGCVTGVYFGTVAAESFSNQQALLDCGSTTTVDAVAPPGTIGATVAVTVTTVESDLTGDQATTTADYTYTAVAPLFTADTPPSTATVGGPYSYTFVASGDPAPAYAVGSGSLPPGLSLNATTGVLSGVPNSAGTYAFTVTASNSAGRVSTPTLTITVAAGADTGYLMTTDVGGVFGFGHAPVLGSLAGIHLNQPIVGMAAAPGGGGYWLVASDGGVFNFGDAGFYGSLGNIHLNKPIVGIASTPDGKGYWLVASDGGIFEFGDAHFYGSLGNITLNKPIVGMAPTPTGGGYWLVASDGGIFEFGNAPFHGSLGNITLNKPIVGMAPANGGTGYWLVASDGGIFQFGNAGFYGSGGSTALPAPVVTMLASPDSHGYALLTSNGDIVNYGDFVNYGSADGALTSPVVSGTL
jgi:hypothetical protein